MTNTGKLRLTLKKSLIGRSEKHQVIVTSLGLRKINDWVEMPDNASTRGSIHKIGYMLQVEEL